MYKKPTYEELEQRIEELEKEFHEHKVNQQQSEEALLESEERYRRIYQNIPAMLYSIDSTGKIVDVSDYWLEKMGCEREEVIGRLSIEFLTDESRKHATEDVLPEYYRTGICTDIEYQFIKKDGTIIDVFLSAGSEKDAEGNLVKSLAIINDVTKEKRAEETLQESEGKLNAMLQSIGDHMSMMDKDLNIIWANSIAKKLFGNDIIGKKCHEVYHRRKEPCEPYPCITLKAFMDGGIHKHDTQVIGKDGEILSFHCTANVALKDKEGKPKAVIEISRDVTERKQSDEALREYSKQLQKLSEASFDGVVIMEKGVIQEANKTFVDLFGYELSEIIGMNALDFIAPESKDIVHNKITTGHEKPYEATVQKKDGTKFEVEACGVAITYKGRPARVTAMRDITERKRAEKMLKESERKFRAIFDQTFQFIGLMTTDGTLIDANRAALDFAGVEAKDVLGKPFWETAWWTHSAELRERLKGAITKAADGHFARFEAFHPAPDGTIHYVDISIKPVKNEEGHVHFLIPEGRNITERKHAEEQIKASLSEKEVLLQEIHHRVKNNFEIISSLLDMSSMQTENREIQNLWGVARDRIHSMALIHAQLYQNDRFDQVNMERHTEELVTHLSHIYDANQKKVRTIIEASETYLSLNQAIPCALVLNELITNAFKHAFQEQEKGTVYISINNSADNTIQISVKDDGSGISEGVDLSDATGLGLKLARHLVIGQLKGEMLFSIDNGTEFQIEFKKVQ